MIRTLINIKRGGLVIVCAVGFILTGCHAQANEALEETKGSVSNLTYELVAPPYDDAIEKTLRRLKAGEGAETVRKGSHSFVLITLGQRPSAGYKLVIEDVKQVGNKIIVSYSERKPEGMAAAVISYPAAVIKLPATDLPVQTKKLS